MAKHHRFTRWFVAGMSVTALMGAQGALMTAQAATQPTHSVAISAAANSTSASVPPGVHFDASVRPLAGTSANWQRKFNAVMTVAQSKLGTPYIWGHNEDRGQYGFDCSNFTAYVYHHALGYRMSGASRTQARSVGWRVPIQSMRPGDLIIEDGGRHVGIYAGNGQMIQEGGGLRKVGYLRLTPGSYWYNHITAVKRMF
jgi:cell wall-associated NlpC family hydrolase